MHRMLIQNVLLSLQVIPTNATMTKEETQILKINRDLVRSTLWVLSNIAA